MTDKNTNYDSRRGVDDRPSGLDAFVREQHRQAERDFRKRNTPPPLKREGPASDSCDDVGRPKR